MNDYGRGGGGGGILGAFVFGGLIGVILGLLFAPRSGEETRQMISDRAQDYWGQGVGAYNDAMDKVNETVAQGRETASKSASDLSEKVGEARTRLREQAGETVVPKAKDAVEQAATKAADVADQAMGKAQTTLSDVAQRVSPKPPAEEAVAEAKEAASKAHKSVSTKSDKTAGAGA